MRRQFQVGEAAELTRAFSEADVLAFAELSGDANPVHIDAEAAAQSRFGQRVVHGMLTASLFSTLLGTRLPGPGSVYVSQNLRFVAPVFLGEGLTARVEVVRVREDKPLVTLSTRCVKADGTLAIEGEAVIFVG